MTAAEKSFFRAVTSLDPEEIISAWQSWRASCPIDGIPYSEIRQLPLLEKRLKEAGAPDHPDRAKYRGVHKKQWTENQLAKRALSQALRELSDAGVTPLLLNGSHLDDALSLNDGERANGGAAILIPAQQRRTAEKILKLPKAKNLLAWWRTRHSHRDVVSPSAALRLWVHWFVLPWNPNRGIDALLWESAREAQIGDVRFPTLCPTDQLLYLVAQGRWSHPRDPLMWAVDAALYFAAHRTEIEWSRLAQHSRERKCAPFVHGGLQELAGLGMPIPEAMILKP
ncbi:hypothetical protein BH09SUM1_BH09SUM1_13350 [soil metagenome]